MSLASQVYLFAVFAIVFIGSACVLEEGSDQNRNSSRSATESPQPADSPPLGNEIRELTEVFEGYWTSSKRGDWDRVDSLTLDRPEKFTRCRAMTYEECLQAPKPPDEMPIKTEREIEKLVIPPLDQAMIKRGIPKRIKSGEWSSYTIKRYSLDNDEARLLVEVTMRGNKRQQDVLLLRTVDGWKIIFIAEPGEYEFYAPFRTMA